MAHDDPKAVFDKAQKSVDTPRTRSASTGPVLDRVDADPRHVSGDGAMNHVLDDEAAMEHPVAGIEPVGTASTRREEGARDEASHVGPTAQATRERRRAVVLFLLTLCTTAYSGLLLSGHYTDLQAAKSLLGFDFQAALPAWHAQASIVRQALSFPLALLCILGCHELGHYLQAKRHGVEVSPPFFLPSIPPLGTLGAVIRMHVGDGTTSPSLMRVAAWGPIGGMVPALIVLLLGISWSEHRMLPFDVDSLVYLRGGVLMQSLERLLLGPLPAGADVFLHPVAFAGWAGCFVTALNMLPIGQLDGGHVIYALSPRHAERVAKGAFYALIIAGFFYTGWWVFALLVRFALGVVHPQMTTDGGARGPTRALGYVAIALFLLTFHPTPISHSGVRALWEGVQSALPYAPLWIGG